MASFYASERVHALLKDSRNAQGLMERLFL